MSAVSWLCIGIIVINAANIAIQLPRAIRQHRELVASYYRVIRHAIENARSDYAFGSPGFMRFGDGWRGKHARLQRRAYDRTVQRLTP